MQRHSEAPSFLSLLRNSISKPSGGTVYAPAAKRRYSLTQRVSAGTAKMEERESPFSGRHKFRNSLFTGGARACPEQVSGASASNGNLAWTLGGATRETLRKANSAKDDATLRRTELLGATRRPGRTTPIIDHLPSRTINYSSLPVLASHSGRSRPGCSSAAADKHSKQWKFSICPVTVPVCAPDQVES